MVIFTNLYYLKNDVGLFILIAILFYENNYLHALNNDRYCLAKVTNPEKYA